MQEILPLPTSGIAFFGYSRISNQDREHEISIEVQNKRLTDDGVHRLYWDQMSGDDDNRPDYVQMLGDIEQLAQAGRKVEIVACRLDRLGRNDQELERVIEWLESMGASFRALDGGSYGTIEIHDWMRLKQEAMLAQYWVRQTSATRRRRMQQKRTDGQPTVGKPARGYRFTEDKKALEIDPIQGPQVREAFERYLNGQSLRDVAMFLDISIAGAKYLLNNPVYRGHLQYTEGGRRNKQVTGRAKMPKTLIYNTHKAMITESEWKQIQFRTEENKRLFGANFKTKRYPLQGLAFCEACGHRLSITKSKTNAKNKKYLYLHCRNYKCSNNIRIPYPLIESDVQKAIESRALKLTDFMVQPEEIIDPRILELERELDQLKPFSNRPRIAEEITSIEKEIQQLQQKPEANDIKIDVEEVAKSLIDAHWQGLESSERRAIYQILVRRVSVLGRVTKSVELNF